MPSNVRRYDKSCQNRHRNGQEYYQCKTCDWYLVLYFCSDCKRNSRQHDSHQNSIVKVKWKKDTLFCNCGDLSGMLGCTQHNRQRVNKISKPLHFNYHALNIFSQIFSIPKRVVSNLARINQIRKLDYKSEDGVMIFDYFKNTNAHGRNVHLKKSWSVYRKDHEQIFVQNGFDKTRRMLLWHGTALKNVQGILTKGLQTPNKTGGSVNGAMFGGGVYFADRVSKSLGYTDSTGPGVLFLCEVALGSMYRAGHSADYSQALGKFDSVKGVGLNIPDRTGQKKFDKDIIIPCGPTIKNPNPSIPSTMLAYNEFIVFDPGRVLIKFIVQFD